jgi:hypothetical protein
MPFFDTHRNSSIRGKDRMYCAATISGCGRYRYDLTRVWNRDYVGLVPRLLNVIGLNPSTADAKEDDPTIRRCINFGKAWGMDGLLMTNLFAFRSTDPSALYDCEDPIGELNDEYLTGSAQVASIVLVAWGTAGNTLGRDKEVLRLLKDSYGVKPECLATTKKGFPQHPLYVRADAERQLYLKV